MEAFVSCLLGFFLGVITGTGIIAVIIWRIIRRK